jgi:hypothetical protein
MVPLKDMEGLLRRLMAFDQVAKDFLAKDVTKDAKR